MPHVLLLGGHGKIAMHLTPLLLRRSWTVTSIIRNPDHASEINDLKGSHPGKLNVLVKSLDDVTSEAKAKEVLDEVKPDYVAWSAGAGGKGGAERTFAIDRDACIHYINASASTPSITKFLLISYTGSRRLPAPWWSPKSADDSWDTYNEKVNYGVLANYYKAKIEADEVLYRVSRSKGEGFVGINLRPGALTDENEGGVELGKTSVVKGNVGRGKVAKVMDELLATEGVKNCWLDLFDGEKDVKQAVDQAVADGVDTVEGEPVAKE